jgi:hypothetical protein
VTAQWVFNLYTPKGELFDAYNCEADCSIVPFHDKTGPAVASFACSIVEGPTKLKSAVLVQLAVADTVHLHGKYVYQITIKMPIEPAGSLGPPGPMDSAYGKIDIPLHGILYIGKNIKPEFITE